MALTKIPSELSSTTGIVDNSNATAITIDSNENVGIGSSSPDTLVQATNTSASTNYISYEIGNSGIGSANKGGFAIYELGGLTTSITYARDGTGHTDFNADTLVFNNAANTSERMRIDASGNLLVGTTSTDPAASSTETGVTLKGGGFVSISRNDSAASVNINKIGYDGSLVDFRKNGSTVGSIGVNSNGYLQTLASGDNYRFGDSNSARWSVDAIRMYPMLDNTYDLGLGSFRIDTLFAANSTINTSDRNEKQDIAELSDAEQRAAVACKGLLRKFRWKDAVSKKGDDARIHFGIIAQDLQAAFEAEGLDASRYAMWCSDTWWEQDVEVPAVEAVDAVYETQTDEEGNETQVLVQEAVEAVDAYTRTDTFETAEEAPEGATEKTRLGVRYSELLAFIISAI